jgi:poly(3-hydroxyoctanoate) depolymerase
VNARILVSLIRRAKLQIFNDGHLFLISSADEAAKAVREFLDSSDRRN